MTIVSNVRATITEHPRMLDLQRVPVASRRSVWPPARDAAPSQDRPSAPLPAGPAAVWP